MQLIDLAGGLEQIISKWGLVMQLLGEYLQSMSYVNLPNLLIRFI